MECNGQTTPHQEQTRIKVWFTINECHQVWTFWKMEINDYPKRDEDA